jgi:hypothetical protein
MVSNGKTPKVNLCFGVCDSLIESLKGLKCYKMDQNNSKWHNLQTFLGKFHYELECNDLQC